MLRYLNRSGLIEQGFQRLGQKDGKTIFKRIVPKLDLEDWMKYFPNNTTGKQVTEFVYLDDATDKVSKICRRHVGEYGDIKSPDRRVGTEFYKYDVKNHDMRPTFKHITETQAAKEYAGIQYPARTFVVEHNIPESKIGREVNMATFEHNGNIVNNTRSKIIADPNDPNNLIQEVMTYETGWRPGKVETQYLAHRIAPNGGYIGKGWGSGTSYKNIDDIGGIPQYTSWTDVKANKEFFIDEFTK